MAVTITRGLPIALAHETELIPKGFQAIPDSGFLAVREKRPRHARTYFVLKSPPRLMLAMRHPKKAWSPHVCPFFVDARKVRFL